MAVELPPRPVTMTGHEDRPVDRFLPDDARRLGILPEVAPGIAAAASLRADRALDRVIAWVCLAVLALGIVIGVAAVI